MTQRRSKLNLKFKKIYCITLTFWKFIFFFFFFTLKYFTMKYKYYQIMTTPRHHINKSLHVLMLSLMLYQICSNFSKESKHRYPYMQMLLMIYIYESYKSLLSLTLPFLLFLKSAMLSKTNQSLKHAWTKRENLWL